MPSIRDLMGDGAETQEGEQMPQQGQAMSPEQGLAGAEQQLGPNGEQPVTEQEQGAYEQVVMAIGNVLYDDATSPQVVQMLKSQEDPAQAIAAVVVMVVTELDDQSGGQIPEEVILPAATEATELVAELAVAKGVFEVDEATLNRAAQHVVQMLSERYGVEEEDVAQMMQGVDPAAFEPQRAQQEAYSMPPEQANG
jgi:hypothetical protein